MMKLVTFPPAFGLRNVSPFCLKIEMLLTSLGLEFELSEQSDPRKAPKGKLPVLLVDGEPLPDSELIAEHLDGLTHGGVYGGLGEREKGLGVACARLADDHLYWILVASRWLDDAWWPNVVEGFFGFVPRLIRPLAAGAARRQVRQTYHLHGLGRHSLEEQRGFARRDLAALQALVSEGGFLLGDAPNVFDFGVASLLAGVYDQQPGSWLTPIARECGKLHEYTERVQAHVGVWGRPAP
ncbi:MAG: glutathione S-transferase family protein [Myxococcales bacterium]|nr:glutathione S-transferase family protein [Myxococcales bacterium]